MEKPKDWVREFAGMIEADETVVVETLHFHHKTPNHIVAVKTADIPAKWHRYEIIPSSQEVYYFDEQFLTIARAQYRMLFDLKKAQDVVYDLFKAASFGVELVNLSEAFDINIGKGWDDFKKLALPPVQRTRGEV